MIPIVEKESNEEMRRGISREVCRWIVNGFLIDPFIDDQYGMMGMISMKSHRSNYLINSDYVGEGLRDDQTNVLGLISLRNRRFIPLIDNDVSGAEQVNSCDRLTLKGLMNEYEPILSTNPLYNLTFSTMLIFQNHFLSFLIPSESIDENEIRNFRERFSQFSRLSDEISYYSSLYQIPMLPYDISSKFQLHAFPALSSYDMLKLLEKIPFSQNDSETPLTNLIPSLILLQTMLNIWLELGIESAEKYVNYLPINKEGLERKKEANPSIHIIPAMNSNLAELIWWGKKLAGHYGIIQLPDIQFISGTSANVDYCVRVLHSLHDGTRRHLPPNIQMRNEHLFLISTSNNYFEQSSVDETSSDSSIPSSTSPNSNYSELLWENSKTTHEQTHQDDNGTYLIINDKHGIKNGLNFVMLPTKDLSNIIENNFDETNDNSSQTGNNINENMHDCNNWEVKENILNQLKNNDDVEDDMENDNFEKEFRIPLTKDEEEKKKKKKKKNIYYNSYNNSYEIVDGIDGERTRNGWSTDDYRCDLNEDLRRRLIDFYHNKNFDNLSSLTQQFQLVEQNLLQLNQMENNNNDLSFLMNHNGDLIDEGGTEQMLDNIWEQEDNNNSLLVNVDNLLEIANRYQIQLSKQYTLLKNLRIVSQENNDDLRRKAILININSMRIRFACLMSECVRLLQEITLTIESKRYSSSPNRSSSEISFSSYSSSNSFRENTLNNNSRLYNMDIPHSSSDDIESDDSRMSRSSGSEETNYDDEPSTMTNRNKNNNNNNSIDNYSHAHSSTSNDDDDADDFYYYYDDDDGEVSKKQIHQMTKCSLLRAEVIDRNNNNERQLYEMDMNEQSRHDIDSSSFVDKMEFGDESNTISGFKDQLLHCPSENHSISTFSCGSSSMVRRTISLTNSSFSSRHSFFDDTDKSDNDDGWMVSRNGERKALENQFYLEDKFYNFYSDEEEVNCNEDWNNWRNNEIEELIDEDVKEDEEEEEEEEDDDYNNYWNIDDNDKEEDG
ncbi:hypothetical protein SNEBB_006505 [Seison nebaliae]|nr:hypothetical protein SNEBB_006505 [Seison nebaliae]